MKIYSVYDSKVGAYMPPIFLRSNGEAIRMFASSVNTPDHQFARNADDYTLFELGEFDDVSGKFNILPTPISLGLALHYLSNQPSVADLQLAANTRV